ncbi:putative lipid II flippase FtsW [Sediminibacillus halophilus]|uniref:Probable peptidoglycan glycosyltransferase FtsW n=1 Tax=Sediminibacillus halophilus TaxID=482461 RepID=A0A1G9MW03_9BACI|nr:putative lipid II flippase FtsW [Sediminibacillus halophilus]SDL78097.1 cell division protein FtsW [Sediminibacillus halophilus]
MKQKWKDLDFTLFITPLLLTAFGIVMIYSASMVIAVIKNDVPSNYFMVRQLMWFGLGFVFYLFCSMFAYRHYQKLIKPMIIMIFLLLVAVLFFGDEVNNAKSWLVLGPFRLQPAELAKLGLIIYLASAYSKKQQYIDDFFKAVLPPLVMTGMILVLIIKQPDIGTAAIILMIAATVIFSSGIKFRHLFLLGGAVIVIVGLAATKMVTPERISRFTGAYQPFDDPDLNGFHLIQSYLAIGTGGITGQGLGQGIQKLGYLPEPHTDFIMAVIAEELGFLGVIVVLGMLAAIVLRGLYIANQCRDSFGSLLAIGISSMIGIQAFINLGAISGLLPITGVTLPFVSYGGSSLLILLISTGILNNIAKSVRANEQRMTKETIPDEIESEKNKRALRQRRSWSQLQ